jgi:hypothetical protein
MLPNEANKFTDNEILEKAEKTLQEANNKLMKELGLNGYLRYLQLQPNNEDRDYLLIREETFKDTTLDDVYNAAAKQYEEKQK